MTNHTPTPWKVEQRQGQEFYMLTHGEIAVLRTFGDSKGDLEDIVRARICVNACAGVNPEAVQDLVAFTQNIRADATPGSHPRIYESPEEIRNAAHSVLAKAKLP